jgi:dephospho-CoA kinase
LHIFGKGVRPIYIIGIAGKMASGKSTVCSYLKEFIPETVVLNVDSLAKEIYCENPGLVERLKACFGECILSPDGYVDYKNLGRIVFSSKDDLEKLNNIMADEIIKKIQEFLKKNIGVKCVIIDAAILFNIGINKLCDLIIWVTADKRKRLKLLKNKTGMPKSEAIMRIEGQHIKYIKKLVDFTIRNNGSKISLEKKIFELAEKIKPDIYASKY